MDKFREFVRAHPHVMLGAVAMLVAFDVVNLLKAMELFADAKRAVADQLGEAQRAASEALGG